MISGNLISIVVPCHNSSRILHGTIDALLKYEKFGVKIEIVLVENGSSDETWRICQDFAISKSQVVALQSETGLGNAFRAGVIHARGDFIYFTADDLPFGESDFVLFLAKGSEAEMVVSSKSHPQSQTSGRGWRNIISWAFSIAQRLITRIPLTDTQASSFLTTRNARLIYGETRESGFLITLEALLIAYGAGLTIIEVPVKYEANSRQGKTTIRPKDVYQMFTGLFRLRSRFNNSLNN